MGRGKLLRKIVNELYGDEVASKIWGRIEILGDIAVIRKPPNIELNILKNVANKLLEVLPYIKSVWAAVSPIEGKYRVREFIHLAGEERSNTTYREHGCMFRIDITQVYISPVLNYEHIRVAKQVKPGEFIINMFAGAGLFSIIIAKHARPSKVISIDINPKAYELMIENVKLNKVEDIVEPVLGDSGVIILNYRNMANRVLMPLPELSLKYLPQAIQSLESTGIIHVYDFISTETRKDALKIAEEIFGNKVKELGYEYRILNKRVVRSVGPRMYQVVLDIEVRKES